MVRSSVFLIVARRILPPLHGALAVSPDPSLFLVELHSRFNGSKATSPDIGLGYLDPEVRRLDENNPKFSTAGVADEGPLVGSHGARVGA